MSAWCKVMNYYGGVWTEYSTFSFKEQNAFLFLLSSHSLLSYFVSFPLRKSTKHFGFCNELHFIRSTALDTDDPTSTSQDQVGRENSRRCSFKSCLMEPSRSCPPSISKDHLSSASVAYPVSRRPCPS